MNKLKKYSTYKNSGVEWLGNIPEGWETLANKHIFKIEQNLVGKNSNDYDLLSLTLKGIIKRDMDNPKGKFPIDFDTYQEVKKNDFVFCLFDVEETPRTIGLSKYDGMITGAYTVMQVHNVNKNYLYYFYLNLDSSKRFKPLYKGLRNTIPKDSFFSFKTFIPPKPEQTKIATFLDIKTKQLDKAIKQKEQLIELLKERRQILINDAVTKGLDKTVSMKNSGVEWIGDIPKHWTEVKLKWISKRYAGGTPDKNNLKFWNNGTIPWIASGEVNQEIVTKSTAKITEQGFKYSSARWMPRNSLIVALAGQGKTKGMVAYLDIDTTGNQSLSVIIPNQRKITSKYMFYFIKSAYKELRGSAGDGQRDGLNLEKLGILNIIYPLKEEQQLIVNYIEENNQKIDKAIDLQQQQVTKLKEYKTTLIDSVVTGKVRVI
jgi:type I restriction enzyme S subunit